MSAQPNRLDRTRSDDGPGLHIARPDEGRDLAAAEAAAGQERLTKQVADWLQEQLSPRAVGVVIAAEHSCMTLRGVHATGSSTVTSALLGNLRDDPSSRHEFLSLAGVMSH